MQKGILPPSKELLQLSQCWNNIKPSTCSLIVFDLETSGLSVNKSEILQLSAVWKNMEFNNYVLPKYRISPQASAVNKLYIVDGMLFYNGKPVNSTLLVDTLKLFLDWLSYIPSPRILVGHNVKRFDCPHLFAALAQHNLVDEFCNLVIGFIDTLPIYREIRLNMPDYRQNTLVKCILGQLYDEHNAIEDVRALQKLINHTQISDLIFLKHSFTSESVWNFCQLNSAKKKNLKTYYQIINHGISRGMADKFSQNGITYYNIVHAYRRGGRSEVEQLLGEEVNGCVNGTQNKKVIDRIIEYIERS